MSCIVELVGLFLLETLLTATLSGNLNILEILILFVIHILLLLLSSIYISAFASVSLRFGLSNFNFGAFHYKV